MTKQITSCLAALLVTTVATASFAAERAEGVVVQTDHNEVVVDIGAADGIPARAKVQVFRRLEVTHPVTKKKIVDRFPIGTIVLDEVGDRLSITKSWGGLTRAPQPGDWVVWEEPAKAPLQTPPKKVDAEGSQVRDERSDLDRAFLSTLGRSVPDRIAIYEQYLRTHPQSPFEGEVQNELHWLRLTLEAQRSVPESAAVPPAPRADGTTRGPQSFELGTPLALTATVDDPSLVSRMRVHVRRDGSPHFETHEMKRTGDHNWSAAIDEGDWQPSDTLTYYAEAIREDGQVEQMGETKGIAVTEPTRDPLTSEGRSRAAMLGEFVNFKAGAGDDEFYRFESEYRYALRIPVLTGFTAGAGIFRGSGGTVREIQSGEPSRTLNLAYGFAEVDLELWRYVGITTRFLLGNHRELSLDGGLLDDAFGMKAELWFGEFDGTKLVTGAAFTEGIGAEAWIRLWIDAIEDVPMSGDVEVTNLPVGGDLGVSLNYSVGYAFTNWFTLMGRLGWNARTIDHHGPTLGLGTTFTW